MIEYKFLKENNQFFSNEEVFYFCHKLFYENSNKPFINNLSKTLGVLIEDLGENDRKLTKNDQELQIDLSIMPQKEDGVYVRLKEDESLVDLFNSLEDRTSTTSKKIFIRGIEKTIELSQSDLDIAINKNWEVDFDIGFDNILFQTNEKLNNLVENSTVDDYQYSYIDDETFLSDFEVSLDLVINGQPGK
jgi:hypothetical protein